MRVWEGFVAAKTICIDMTQDISSSGVDVDMLVGLKPPTTIFKKFHPVV